MGKGQDVRIMLGTACEGDVKVELGFRVTIDEQTVFLAMGLVKDDKAAGPFGGRGGRSKLTTFLRLRAILDHWQR
jgi:hypothetical protein